MGDVCTVRGVRKTFEAELAPVRALRGVDLDVGAGEFVAIMGPSGSGKSVLLRHFVGLLMPDAGDVIVDGRQVPRLEERELVELRRQLGMVFQGLFRSMNLYDNVAFPLRQQTRKSEREIRRIVAKRLGEVGLAGAETRMPAELSLGMRNRAGLARALVLEPKILLFDEPDAGLDPLSAELICQLIRQVQRRYHSTVVVVSRDTAAVLEIADHVVLLHHGRVVEQGTRRQVRASERAFTKQFLATTR